MNHRKLEVLIKLLKENGVGYLKTLEVEIKFQEGVKSPFIPAPEIKSESIPPPTDAAIPPVENMIPHHVNEVSTLLKLNDYDLVDKLFPDYTMPKAEG